MRVKFWGVRGSIPTPGPQTVRYGGNTACIEVKTGGDEILILDAGTGIRPLGLECIKNASVSCSVFITHTHWDHIHGLPFFAPLFSPTCKVSIYGMANPVTMGSIRDVLTVQLDYRFFPIREAELQANVQYETMTESNSVQIGDVTISAILMNHPVLCLGYLVAHNGRSLFYTGDHEPYQNIYAPHEPEYDDYQQHILHKKQAMLEKIRGVDLLIADAQYTDDEYLSKTGWGHSPMPQAIQMAQEAGIPAVCLTHHEPTRDDGELDALLANLRLEQGALPPRIVMAREGEEIEV